METLALMLSSLPAV